jgi:hypothetical protein
MKAEFIDLEELAECRKVLTACGDGSESHFVASVRIDHGQDLPTRVNIQWSAGHSCFKDVRCINGFVYIGFGQHVFVVDVQRSEIRRHRLDGYFGHLYDSTDLENLGSRFSVLATSASEVLAFGQAGNLIWTQPNLGIDGVVLHSVSAGCLKGDGEWDPPDGWQAFALTEDTGEVLR